MDKCCGTCECFALDNTPGYSDKGKCLWDAVNEPSPFWININRTHVFDTEGCNCPTYEPKITLDKPHRPT